MSYGGVPYAGGPYAGALLSGADISADTKPALAVEVSFTTGAFEEPVWVDITTDVRSASVKRGRNRELERFQPGRATIVLGNLSRQYDSANAAGPWFGNLKPMRRIRIRETFSGVTYPTFDGYVDRWNLDYPLSGKDATATVTATDMFKVLARSDLPLSVYHDTVLADFPSIYWRLDEKKNAEDDGDLLALNAGTLGSTADGVYVGPPQLGGEPLVVNDPGSSATVTNSIQTPSTGLMGVTLNPFDILGGGSLTARGFVFEAWVLPTHQDLNNIWVFSDTDGDAQIFYQTATTFRFSVTTGGSTFTCDSAASPSHKRYHLVAKFTPGSPLELWVNGTRTTGGTPTGAIADVGNDLFVGHRGVFPDSNWAGNISHVAVYLDAAATAVNQSWVDRHYEAGTHPWQGDLPGERAARILDLVGVPAALRRLEDGDTELQSASLDRVTALEHLQKIAETEFGLFFIDRAGAVYVSSRETVFGREPDPAVFGDDAGEVGYRNIRFDDGDAVIRNRATISRLNGVAKVAEDADSIEEFGPFDYRLDGLLHRPEQYSQDYANLIPAEYGDSRRRVVGLDLGPVSPADAALIYPQMLGRELGDAVVVRHTPPGGGARFEQTCVIEGIQHEFKAGGKAGRALRTCQWLLSPEFLVRSLEDEEVATLGYAQVTTNQGSITTITDLTGLSVTVTVGSSRYIRITGSVFVQSTAADRIRLSIREGTTVLQLRDDRVLANDADALDAEVVLVAPSAGSHTYKLSLNREAGSGTVTSLAAATFPAFILVEDIGPA